MFAMEVCVFVRQFVFIKGNSRREMFGSAVWWYN